MSYIGASVIVDLIDIVEIANAIDLKCLHENLEIPE